MLQDRLHAEQGQAHACCPASLSIPCNRLTIPFLKICETNSTYCEHSISPMLHQCLHAEESEALEPEQQHPSLLALQALGKHCKTCSHRVNSQGVMVKQRLMGCSASCHLPRSNSSSSACRSGISSPEQAPVATKSTVRALKRAAFSFGCGIPPVQH